MTTLTDRDTVAFMESKLAKYAEQSLIEAARELTAEQRLAAFFEHSRLMIELHRAGQQERAAARPAPDREPS